MATTEHSNIAGVTSAADEQQEREVARKLAERYRYAFIDLREQRIDPELFRTIPADLMFRYNFVPLEIHGNVLSIAAADPGQVQMSDELPLLLGKKLAIKVATPRQIADLLKRTEQSQRVLEQATEAFTLQVAKEEEESEETISGDRLTRDTTVSQSPEIVSSLSSSSLATCKVKASVACSRTRWDCSVRLSKSAIWRGVATLMASFLPNNSGSSSLICT